MKTRSVHLVVSGLSVALLAGGASADIVASYVSGVAPTAGTTGAADPATQGWVASTASPGSYNYGSDSTLGGWRITDGTTGGNFFYQLSLGGTDAANLGAQDWTATWTTTLHGDAVSINDVPNGVDDYYLNNPGLQNDNGIWVESAVGGFTYILRHQTDAAGDVFISDGTTAFQITSTGGQLAQELGAGAPSANYITYTLQYSATSGTASLSDSLGGSHGVVSPDALVASVDRVVWGAYSSPGQGSTVWNGLAVDVIPEPASALLMLGGLWGLCALRRRTRG